MDLRNLLQRPDVRIMVVGDVMLDYYRIAQATRISPEAPVPVLLNSRDEYRLGGAAAVAGMCAALGAETWLIGVVGMDRSGEIVRELLEQSGVKSLLFSAPYPRPTTLKERICGVASGRHRQQLARLDTEWTTAISDGLENAVVHHLRNMEPPDAILIADYAKGVLTHAVARVCIESGCLTIVDPPREGDWTRYRGAACVVPNRQEAGGCEATEIQERCQSMAAVVKLDEEGCQVAWDDVSGERCQARMGARSRAVHDVTGAGDNFLAVLGCARASGWNWPAAAELANLAAGLQVERHGCVPVTLNELREELDGDGGTISQTQSAGTVRLSETLAAAR